ncbi:hypothetical protein RGE_26580 [Rubrivivax gelatinosus IL144]|uniref:Uncharacterized protein n=1 Tax=Rubrivivax gelatinosus (strain NBRC 100245 / IL144) TaxID=983917 RepID=I0HSL0_RUBGI|nr:hypothetical protein RGE_26580 [Rubrivivax gelatinosus IL144]
MVLLWIVAGRQGPYPCPGAPHAEAQRLPTPCRRPASADLNHERTER